MEMEMETFWWDEYNIIFFIKKMESVVKEYLIE